MDIYCCACEKKVLAELTSGEYLYPNRPDLFDLPFWICRTCHGTVGCHHKTADRTRPLGYLANHRMTKIRRRLHEKIDPIWKSGKMSRKALYRLLSKKLGRRFHVATLRNVLEAEKIIGIVDNLIQELE